MTIEEHEALIIHRVKMAATWNKRAKLFANAAKQATGEKKGKYFSLTRICVLAAQRNIDESQHLMLAVVGVPRNVDKITVPSEN